MLFLPFRPGLKNKKPRTCGAYMFGRRLYFDLASLSKRLGHNVGLDLGFVGIGKDWNFRMLDGGFIWIRLEFVLL